MAKFFNILAASVGSGIVLGASIRLGEALGGKLKAGLAEPNGSGPPPVHSNPASPAFLRRLDHLEKKMSRALSRFDAPVAASAVPVPDLQTIVANVVARMDRQQSDVDAIRRQVSKAERALDSVGEMANHLRTDLQNELSRSLDERLAAVEARVHLRMEGAHGQTLDAMVSAMESKVTPRIVRMESDIARQSAAVSELRECALQSERSIQRLLGVLERVVAPSDSAPPRQGGPGQSSGNYKPLVAAIPFAPERAAEEEAPARMPSSFAVFNPIS
jgi:hypothetical protein